MKPEKQQKLWRVKRHNGHIDGFWVVEYEGFDEEKARATYTKKTTPRPPDTIWSLTYEWVEEMSHTPSRQLWNVRNGGKGTKLPCQGCGEKPGYGTREDGKVCATCADHLLKYDEIQKRLAERAGEFIRVPRYWPGYYLSHRDLRIESSELAKKMGRVVTELTEPVPTGRWNHGNVESLVKRPEQWRHTEDRSDDHIVEMPKDAVEAIRDLDVSIYAALDKAYMDGLNYGQNLLKQLSAGDMTVGEFNDHVSDREQEKRDKAAEDERERRKRR